MDSTTRHKLRRRALILWTLFAGFFLVFSIPAGAPPSLEYALFWLALLLGMEALVGFPIVYGFVLAEHVLTSRWRQRWRPRFSPDPPARSPSAYAGPFRYEGRRWKTTVGVLAFVLGMAAFAWLLPIGGDEFLDAMLVVLRWFAVALAAIAVPASLLGLRAVVFEVDDLGVRVRGRLRSFDARWDDLDRLEVTQYAGLPFPLHEGMKLPKTYALWRKAGTVAGILSPGAEVGAREGGACEGALLAYASRRGIPVVVVPWRSTRTWWRMRGRASRMDAR